MIQVSGVTHSYGGKKIVLSDIDKKFSSGKIYGIVGPNGAGKTTLLNVISGINSPKKGTVEIDGFNIKKNREKALSRIGFMPDRVYLENQSPVLPQIAYFGTFYGLKYSDSMEKAKSLLAEFGLPKEFWNRPTVRLSLGQRRRVSWVMATLHNPENLLMDEPYNGFDPFGMRQLTDYILEARDRGNTVLISSHILKEVQSIADEFIYIDRGRLEKSIETDEIEKASGKVWIRVKNPDDNFTNIVSKFGDVRRIGQAYELTPNADLGLDVSEINQTLVKEGYKVESIYQEKRTVEDEFFQKKNN